MANRRDYYFRQKVTEAELDAGFAGLEDADRNIAIDNSLVGVVDQMGVGEAAVPDLTVDVAAGTAYSKSGERIDIVSPQNVDMSQDDSAVSTAVSTPGNEKIVSLFVVFDRNLSDPRIDGNSNTVYHVRDEAFSFSVIQGAEAAGGAAVPPALNSGKILLADIHLEFGTTTITNAGTIFGSPQIDTSRREDAFRLTGGTIEVVEGTPLAAVDSLLTSLNQHVDGGSNQHPAADITYGGSGNWASGSPLTGPPTDVEAGIDQVVADLARLTGGIGSGAEQVGADAQSSGGESVTQGSIFDQIGEILAAIAAKLPLAGGTLTGDLDPSADGVDLGNAAARWDAFLQQADIADRILAIGEEANYNQPRINFSALPIGTSYRTLMWRGYLQSGSNVLVSCYHQANSGITEISDDALEFVVNAFWDQGSQVWDHDEDPKPAARVIVAKEGVRIETKAAGPVAAWADNAWDDPMNLFPSSPTHSATTVVNSLYNTSIPKCWGYVDIAAGTIQTAQTKGINFTPSISTDDLLVTFSTAMSSANYAVVAMSVAGSFGERFMVASSLTTSTFLIRQYNNAGGQLGFSTGNHRIAFVVMALQ